MLLLWSFGTFSTELPGASMAHGAHGSIFLDCQIQIHWVQFCTLVPKSHVLGFYPIRGGGITEAGSPWLLCLCRLPLHAPKCGVRSNWLFRFMEWVWLCVLDLVALEQLGATSDTDRKWLYEEHSNFMWVYECTFRAFLIVLRHNIIKKITWIWSN